MADPPGRHLGRRHLDPRHTRGDWFPDRTHHTAPTDPDTAGHPLGRAARKDTP